MGVTIKDIARATGYSANTVSRALSERGEISEATSSYIKEVAEKMGYIHNSIASSLRAGKTNTIAVIIGSIFNSHFSILIKEIEEAASKGDYTVLILNTNEDEASERKAIKTAIGKNVDGIIMCPVQSSTENIRLLKSSGIPFVLIGRHFDDMDTDYVVCDDYRGGKCAAEYLLEKGKQRIYFIIPDTYTSSQEERSAGFRDAFMERRGEFRDEQIILKKADKQLVDCFEENSTSLLGADAILCFSDEMAHALIYWLRSHNKTIPGDIDIIGFDDIQSRISMPIRVKSVKSYKSLMSHTAYEILTRRIQDPSAPTQHVVISTELSEGETA